MDTLEIDWIPEDTGAPYTETDMTESDFVDMPAHLVDKICKKKFGHTNWARMSQMSPIELAGNPCDIDYVEGIVYFKNRTLVQEKQMVVKDKKGNPIKDKKGNVIKGGKKKKKLKDLLPALKAAPKLKNLKKAASKLKTGRA